MTMHAREVLTDCERLIEDFEHATDGHVLWRARWVGIVTLLRAVGHVLDKVDKNGSGDAKMVIEQAWKELEQTKPEPAIFWRFIDDERNSVLKTYTFGAHGTTTVRPGALGLNVLTGEVLSGDPGPTTYEFFLRSGTFQGKDAMRTCRDGLAFWRHYLDRIDRDISERSRGR